MKIEDEIRVSGFSSNFHKAMVNLYFTYKWFEQCLDEVFDKYDVLPQHFNVLRIINGKGKPCPIRDIKDVMMDKGRDLTRLMDKLESKGYISRELNPENRRQMLVSVTKEGRQMVQKMNGDLMAKLESINMLTDAEAIHLSNLLDKVRLPKD